MELVITKKSTFLKNPQINADTSKKIAAKIMGNALPYSICSIQVIKITFETILPFA